MSVMSQLNVVMLPVFAAAVNVNVAWIDAPASRTVFCRFQVNISEAKMLVYDFSNSSYCRSVFQIFRKVNI